jgi:hypothetical protein
MRMPVRGCLHGRLDELTTAFKLPAFKQGQAVLVVPPRLG